MSKKLILLIMLLVALGFASRTIFHLGANFELVTAISIVAGLLIKTRWSFIVPLSIMISTDLVIGNSIIFLFTWSGFLAGHLLARLLAAQITGSTFAKVSKATLVALVSVVIFYLWTNFGVVVTSSLYPHTLAGLLQSYVNAIPFVRPQLLSALVFTPIIFVAVNAYIKFPVSYLRLYKFK